MSSQSLLKLYSRHCPEFSAIANYDNGVRSYDLAIDVTGAKVLNTTNKTGYAKVIY
jgi:hypothetical protein